MAADRVGSGCTGFDAGRFFESLEKSRGVAADGKAGHMEKPTEELGETLESPADSPEKAMLLQNEADRVRKAVDSLPARQKEALILCYYQDLKAKDAAQILGLSQGATEALLFRARQSLKDVLGKEK